MSREISPDSTFPPFLRQEGPTAGPEQESRGGEGWKHEVLMAD